MSSTSQYRISAKMTPQHKLEAVDLAVKCLFGISVSATPRCPLKMAAALDWALDRFSNTQILIGDSLYRITLQLQRGLHEDLALKTAQGFGDAQLEAIQQCAKRWPQVIRTSEILRENVFLEALTLIENLYTSDIAFSNSVQSDAAIFVERQLRRGRLFVSYEAALALSIRYLIEEVAVYLVLAHSGWLLDVYVGKELPTLARIIQGEIPAAPISLKNRTNISLEICNTN